MSSEVGIVNGALIKLGTDRIVAFTDNSKAGRLATDTYAEIRDALLRAHPWNFALVRVALSADATAPVYEFDNSYPLPEDPERCIRVLNVEGEDEGTGVWRVEGRAIVTDLTSPINIRYVKEVTDTEQMDPTFREVLSARLAMEWAEAISRNTALTSAMTELYRLKLAEARAIDGQEEIPVAIEAASWIDSRF